MREGADVKRWGVVMNEVVQHIMAGTIVTLAVGYVVRRAWRLLRGKSRGMCGGCRGCSVTPVVSLESLTDSRTRPTQ